MELKFSSATARLRGSKSISLAPFGPAHSKEARIGKLEFTYISNPLSLRMLQGMAAVIEPRDVETFEASRSAIVGCVL